MLKLPGLCPNLFLHFGTPRYRAYEPTLRLSAARFHYRVPEWTSPSRDDGNKEWHWIPLRIFWSSDRLEAGRHAGIILKWISGIWLQDVTWIEGTECWSFVSSWSLSVPPTKYRYSMSKQDHLCGLVVRVPGCRSGGLGSIPSATSFSEK
jgi:hypothetical protein